jgi:hypothetical protein
MYCLSFTEIGLETKNFFFHSFIKAQELQRQLLIVEINNIITSETDEQAFKFNNVEDGTTNMSNYYLERLLNTLIKLNYRDEWEHHIINIEINDILFEDTLFNDDI